jgi:hypothetical protein
VTGANLDRAVYSRRNATAQLFQCWNSDRELSDDVPDDVFAEESMSPAGVEHVNCSVEQPSVVGIAKPFSGDAVPLTGVA